MNLGLAPRAAQVLNRQVEPKNSVNTGDRLDLIDPRGNTNQKDLCPLGHFNTPPVWKR